MTVVADAVGPQSLTVRELVDAVRTRRRKPQRRRARSLDDCSLPLSRTLNSILQDTLLTPDEYHAMADGLADSDAQQPEPSFTDWVAKHGPELGRHYANELDRTSARRADHGASRSTASPRDARTPDARIQSSPAVGVTSPSSPLRLGPLRGMSGEAAARHERTLCRQAICGMLCAYVVPLSRPLRR